MQLYKKTDDRDLLRLESEDASSVTVRRLTGRAQLLSVRVEKDNRRKGIGRALLTACEGQLYAEGMHRIEAYYPETMEGMSDFLKAAGYRVEPVAPVVSLDVKGMLSIPAVKQFLTTEQKNTVCISLSELLRAGGEAFGEFVSAFALRINNSDLARFDKTISCGVYDEMRRPKALLLCSRLQEQLVIELLAGLEQTDPAFIAAAIRGMFRTVVKNGGAAAFHSVSLMIGNQRMESLIGHFCRKQSEQVRITGIMCASKRLTEAGPSEISVSDDIDKDRLFLWEREVRSVPFLANAIFKIPYLRGEDDPDAIAVYLKEALKELYDEEVFSREVITIREFRTLPYIKSNPPKYIVPVEELSREQLEEGLYGCRVPAENPEIDRLLDTDGEDMERSVSCCVAQDDYINGMLIFRMTEEGNLKPVVCYAAEDTEQQDLIDMLRFFVRAAGTIYGMDQRVLI